MQKNNLTKRQC